MKKICCHFVRHKKNSKHIFIRAVIMNYNHYRNIDRKKQTEVYIEYNINYFYIWFIYGGKSFCRFNHTLRKNWFGSACVTKSLSNPDFEFRVLLRLDWLPTKIMKLELPNYLARCWWGICAKSECNEYHKNSNLSHRFLVPIR